MERAANLVVAYDGSFRGEHGDGHGDGQARGQLLPNMPGGIVMGAFGDLKAPSTAGKNSISQS